jgi:hypothetical protein
MQNTFLVTNDRPPESYIFHDPADPCDSYHVAPAELVIDDDRDATDGVPNQRLCPEPEGDADDPDAGQKGRYADANDREDSEKSDEENYCSAAARENVHKGFPAPGELRIVALTSSRFQRQADGLRREPVEREIHDYRDSDDRENTKAIR